VSPVADVSNEYVFTRAPDAQFVWVTHPPTGGTAQIPIASLPFWAARDWEPCDPPDEVDPTRAHLVEAKLLEQEQAEAEKQAEADAQAEAKAAKPTTKSSKGSD